MNEVRRRILLNASRIFDICVILGAFGVAAGIVNHATIANAAQILSMRVKVTNFVLLALLTALWHICLTQFGLYHSHRMTAKWQQVADIFKATLTCTFILGVARSVFHIRLMPVSGLPIFFLISAVVIIVSRLILRSMLKWARSQGRNLRHALIVGTSDRAVGLARKLESRLDFGYRIAGFVSVGGVETSFSRSGYNLVCAGANLRQFLRHNVVDEVMICLPESEPFNTIVEIEGACDEQGVIVRRVAHPWNSFVRVDQVDGEFLLRGGKAALESWEGLLKRSFDFCGALVLLLLLAPLMAVAALAIRLSSPGPILFAQERVGLQKRTFRMYKFRTMVPDAEKRQKDLESRNEAQGPVFKIKNDPRITPIGRILRKTSIDELPQLLNVVKGDMSLVGPRPLPLRDYAGFSEDSHRRRLSVRPGMTGIWQVEGRSSIQFDQWMKLDLQYIDKWSFALDVQILLKTIPAVIRGSGVA